MHDQQDEDRIVEDKTNTPSKIRDANRDPISGKPGAHPVGAGFGTAVAGAAGAAIGGIVGGPIGAAAGAVIGGVAGGLGGKAAAESVNPTVEETYWRGEYLNRPYVDTSLVYDDYAPAYRYGWSNYDRTRFDDIEPDLRSGWEQARGSSRLNWDRAKPAVRDAWDRLERALPGDADGDGR